MDEHDFEEWRSRTARARHVVALVGFAAAALLFVYGVGRWWVDGGEFARMVPTQCTVVAKEVDWNLRASGGGRRSGRTRAWYEGTAHLELRHMVEGKAHAASFDDPSPERFVVGKVYPCRRDPVDPSRVTLATSVETDTEPFLIGIALILIAVVIRS